MKMFLEEKDGVILVIHISTLSTAVMAIPSSHFVPEA